MLPASVKVFFSFAGADSWATAAIGITSMATISALRRAFCMGRSNVTDAPSSRAPGLRATTLQPAASAVQRAALLGRRNMSPCAKLVGHERLGGAVARQPSRGVARGHGLLAVRRVDVDGADVLDVGEPRPAHEPAPGDGVAVH